MQKTKKGFTLVELLIVMAILGSLVALVAGNFRSSQIRGRDVQRKSDLKQIATALELFYQDYGYYPSSENGKIMACYFDAGTDGEACDWGSGDTFADVVPGTSTERTVYLKNVPMDPASGYEYYYRSFASAQKFQTFAFLENLEDPDCLGGDCETPVVSYECGSETCNFAITSTNASYDD